MIFELTLKQFTVYLSEEEIAKLDAMQRRDELNFHDQYPLAHGTEIGEFIESFKSKGLEGFRLGWCMDKPKLIYFSCKPEYENMAKKALETTLNEIV